MNIRAWKILFLACAGLLSAASMRAAIFTVNTTNDTSDIDLGDGICSDINGKCSVRAAIMQANFTNAIGPSNVIIIPAGLYTLTRPGDDDNAIIGDLDIAQTMTIQGAGSGLTVIDGNGGVTGDRVFQILSTAKNASLSGMTIRNGMKVAGTSDSGGGLYWDGGDNNYLSLTDVVFEANSSHYGGGLYLNYSSGQNVVDIDHVVVRSNVAMAAGGGMVVAFSGLASFEMRNSQLCGNTAFQGGGVDLEGVPDPGSLFPLRIETTEIFSNTAFQGGGFDNGSGNSAFPIRMLNCYLHDNNADAIGGGIENIGGTLVISGSTLARNRAGTEGGGIYTQTGTIDLASSTISGNIVTNNGRGAGIYAEPFSLTGSTVSMTNCTVAANIATNGTGGGILNTNCTVNVRNVLIGNNTAAAGPDFNGTITILGWDLISSTSGTTISGSGLNSKFNVNPLLGPLQDNGGPTPTHALLPGSPAIDGGNDGLNLYPTDQRGAPRLVDNPGVPNASSDACDIGAFEFAHPQLAIRQFATDAVLSWPSYYGGFIVQSTTNLGLANVWTQVPGTPIANGGLYLFTNAPISGAQFYRLKAN
jgi:predicted outer membrane repeat protein